MADGRRKDGKPYKEGNTLPDGDYKVGRGRTPEETRFAPNDGRKRGRRPKGSRNFDKDWEEELSRPVKVVRNGKPIRVSAHHAQVMKTLELANKGKERSQELVFRQAERLGERERQASSRSDDELIAAWLAGLSARPEEPVVISDDDDFPAEVRAGQCQGPENPDDQQQ
jgi:hypothetical protein